ncbi:MAG: hypothetical protein KDG89_05010 [Geminicoccaceae bacterium]|nr:hypothetical protein [Geminicoccaceae bacterium]
MTLVPTLVLLGLGLLLVAYCAWHEHRPRDLGEVSLFPSTILMAVGLLAAVLAAAHLVGFVTGTPLKGRLPF